MFNKNLVLFILQKWIQKLLQNNFQFQIRELVSKMESDIQILLFTATVPDEMMAVSKKFMRNPATILVKNEELTLDGIK